MIETILDLYKSFSFFMRSTSVVLIVTLQLPFPGQFIFSHYAASG